MAGFGQRLRTERERLGVSLERISRETKVNLRHFEELEREEYAALPGGVFRRGIVRAYLMSAGMEEAAWMAGFEASLAEHGQSAAAEEDWAEFAENVGRARKKRETHAGRWLGVLALFLLVAAGAWAVWHFELRARMGHEALLGARAGVRFGRAGLRVSG